MECHNHVCSAEGVLQKIAVHAAMVHDLMFGKELMLLGCSLTCVDLMLCCTLKCVCLHQAPIGQVLPGLAPHHWQLEHHAAAAEGPPSSLLRCSGNLVPCDGYLDSSSPVPFV